MHAEQVSVKWLDIASLRWSDVEIIEPKWDQNDGNNWQGPQRIITNLFEMYGMGGYPPSRPLFDQAAVAIVKNPEWTESHEHPGPIYIDVQSNIMNQSMTLQIDLSILK